MTQYSTVSQLATAFSVSRDVIAAWLVEIGLRTGSGTPTRNALKAAVADAWETETTACWSCGTGNDLRGSKHGRTLNGHEQQAKEALTAMIATARSAIGWGGIQEVLIAMKAKEQESRYENYDALLKGDARKS